jgi:RNA polymerase sigma-70 factor (ECF subfamily)
LFAVALRILRRRDWAEEVLQESFVSIWRHAEEYSAAKSAVMTWMTSIVRNRALDLLRRPQIEASDDYESIVELEPLDAPGPLDALESSHDASRVARCLERLEERQRQSIVLAFFNGLTHAELAENLKQPLGTVKTWIRRGLQRLKGCLESSL